MFRLHESIVNSTFFRRYKILIIRTVVHLFFFAAVFDAFYTNNLENGMLPVKSTNKPVAKRVVLIIADGLRASSIYGKNETYTPFLTSIRKTRGSWGTSRVNLPTETRTGNIAIIAGIDEHPAAAFNRFKSYPTKFDSLLNRTRNVWLISSRSVLRSYDKFNHDRRKLHSYTFPYIVRDCRLSNISYSDKWVFETTEFVLKKNSPKLYFPQTLFIIYLGGMDYCGHFLSPVSELYLKLLPILDQNLRNLELNFQRTFRDNRTTFVFTSDHGMADDGHHGEGSDLETSAPFITWGSGYRLKVHGEILEDLS